MNETLILILGHSPEAAVRWAFMGDGGILEADTAASVEALSEIAERAAQARMTVAVLTGEQAAMRAMATPPRAASKFRAAAAFLLEDDLAENLDQLHVAVARHPGGAGLALAVKTSVMDMWRDSLAEVGLTLDFAAPDYAFLPLESDRASIVCESERVFGAFKLQGFAIERPLADALAVMIADDEEISSIIAFGDQDAERIDYLDKATEWRGLSDDASMFRLYADALQEGTVPNLIQGEYRKRRDWRASVGPWRRAGVLAAACVIAFAGIVVADASRSSRIADRLDQETQALHLAAFPEQQNVSPRVHARRMLAAIEGGARFLPLTTDLAECVEEVGNVQVDRIRYNAARSEFSVNVRFVDINDLVQLEEALAARGVKASEPGGVRRVGNSFVGELQVSLS